ncbi:Mannose-6-phosphate isomerase [Serinicoccus hydrothermalis]|uniref:Mannose-6-phosphate isomerase n=1 Tax=Serinicoccus hydrothermalis TaxID=1758689 RepID=A0A1B1NH13_9MICO|nr:cupin domain-containing protein [Serinicoccus hydrothermalis]ANS80701.1 Mannose-6-phosphate isomerase [Serinicoccus hydrothermalis]
MAPDPISRQTARQSTWHEVCQAYHLVERADLTVVHEHMPAGSAGRPHSHQRSRQFFYVLAGTGTMTLGQREVPVPADSGIEVPPRTHHFMRNDGEDDLEMIVVTTPRASGTPHVREQPLGRDRGGLVVGSHLRHTRSGDLSTVVRFEEAMDTSPFLGQGGLDWHTSALGDPDLEHWVLVDRLDRVIAFGILVGVGGGDTVEIRRMVVAPEGRGQGLGRLLLRQLLEHALANPRVHRVWLDVSADNTRARSLYRAVGFVEKDAPADATLLDNGVYMEWGDTQRIP